MVKCVGKRRTFCEISMGSRKQCTLINESPDPKWDSSMQFLVKDTQDDILCVTVFNKGHYSPDGNHIFFIFVLYDIYLLSL